MTLLSSGLWIIGFIINTGYRKQTALSTWIIKQHCDLGSGLRHFSDRSGMPNARVILGIAEDPLFSLKTRYQR